MANALPMPPVPLTGYVPGEMGRRSQASTRDYVERHVEFAPRRDLGPGVYQFASRDRADQLIYIEISDPNFTPTSWMRK